MKMKIGKHEWRIVNGPLGGLLFEWRRQERDPWQGQRQWPTYDINNGMTLGLPKSLKKLYAKHLEALSR